MFMYIIHRCKFWFWKSCDRAQSPVTRKITKFTVLSILYIYTGDFVYDAYLFHYTVKHTGLKASFERKFSFNM